MRGETNEELLLNGYRVSVLQDEKVLEIGCATVRIYLTLLNYTVNEQDGKYMYFTTI